MRRTSAPMFRVSPAVYGFFQRFVVGVRRRRRDDFGSAPRRQSLAAVCRDDGGGGQRVERRPGLSDGGRRLRHFAGAGRVGRDGLLAPGHSDGPAGGCTGGSARTQARAGAGAARVRAGGRRLCAGPLVFGVAGPARAAGCCGGAARGARRYDHRGPVRGGDPHDGHRIQRDGPQRRDGVLPGDRGHAGGHCVVLAVCPATAGAAGRGGGGVAAGRPCRRAGAIAVGLSDGGAKSPH